MSELQKAITEITYRSDRLPEEAFAAIDKEHSIHYRCEEGGKKGFWTF